MSLPTDVGAGLPSGIQEFDGFSVTPIDTNRWNTPTQSGSTLMAQSGGELVFTNNGAGTKGISYYSTVRNFGKNWRISTDLKLVSIVGTSGEISLCLYKSATCYIKIGPYKTGAINCNCYLRWKNGSDPELGTPLTGDVVDTTNYSTYTFGVINDTILIYYQGVLITDMPFAEMYNYMIKIEAGTGANTDTFTAKANDYEIMNNLDTAILTIGQLARRTVDVVDTIDANVDLTYAEALAIHAHINAGVAPMPVFTDITGTIELHDTTEHIITFDQATYGSKFKVNLFADLEGAKIDYCGFSSAGGALTDITSYANSLTSNNIQMATLTGPLANDAIYFASLVNFKRLDIYMEAGTSNIDNTYAWEYWNGAAWAAIVVTDGTSYGGKVFGKSGSVTWSTVLQKPSGWAHYAIRARITTASALLPATKYVPKASHIQISEDGATGFDSLAAFMSNVLVRVYRKRGDGAYASLPVDLALPFTQCILYRNIELADLPAWTDIKIGFRLSATPSAQLSIPLTGFIEQLEA